MKRISKLIAALLLPVCMSFTGCPDSFAAETEETVYRIGSIEDLVHFSEKCSGVKGAKRESFRSLDAAALF